MFNKFLLWGVLLLSVPAYAEMDSAQMSVWVNEAIVETYTYDYNNYLEREKVISHYYTIKGWIAYTGALNQSKLLETVKKNLFTVNAVATLPPAIKQIDAEHWEAMMPLLVVYKNAQLQEKQTLEVILNFVKANPNEGVRGLAVTSIQTKKSTPLCQCK
jgi:hypothetical protein